MKRANLLGIKIALFSAASVSLIWISTAQARPPCPKIYAPVICDNGKVYPNQCVADRHNGQNCVPYGDL